MDGLRNRAPLLAAIAGLWALLIAELAAVAHTTGGRLGYGVDDAYTHLAIGRTLAEHGVFGVTPHEFASASASLLWPLLLAGTFLVTGVEPLVPGVLAALFATALLWLLDVYLRSLGMRGGARLGVLAATVLVAPLPLLVFLGMDTTLQLFVCTALALCAAGALTAAAPRARRRARLATVVLAPIAVAVRLDAINLLVPILVLMIGRRQYRAAVATALAGAAPIVAFSLWSTAHGALWLPNPVLMKSRLAEYLSGDLVTVLFADGPRSGWGILVRSPQLFAPFAGAIGLLAVGARDAALDRGQALLLLFCLGTLAQVHTAPLPVFHRHEAWLVVLAIVAITTALARADTGAGSPSRRRLLVAVLAVFAAAPLVHRAGVALQQIPIAVRNTQDQQIQMGRFARTFYAGERIGVNDVGAVAFLHGGPIVDFMGLATDDVQRLWRRAHREGIAFRLDEIAGDRQPVIAMIFDAWLGPLVPETWVRVGSWTIAGNLVCGSPTVAFYATSADEVERLEQSLQAFASELPDDVRQSGRHLRAPR